MRKGISNLNSNIVLLITQQIQLSSFRDMTFVLLESVWSNGLHISICISWNVLWQILFIICTSVWYPLNTIIINIFFFFFSILLFKCRSLYVLACFYLMKKASSKSHKVCVLVTIMIEYFTRIVVLLFFLIDQYPLNDIMIEFDIWSIPGR